MCARLLICLFLLSIVIVYAENNEQKCNLEIASIFKYQSEIDWTPLDSVRPLEEWLSSQKVKSAVTFCSWDAKNDETNEEIRFIKHLPTCSDHSVTFEGSFDKNQFPTGTGRMVRLKQDKIFGQQCFEMMSVIDSIYGKWS
jgi:hypothetical protein